MALRNIRTQGDEVLTKKCRPVTTFDRRLHELLDDMTETMINADGVGLAAPQVGILRRAVVVLDTNTPQGEERVIELINPELVLSEGEQEEPEGCLSVPGKYGLVKRPAHVVLRAQNREGEWFEADATGLTARAFCHELDHLDGHMFVELCDHFMSDEELKAYHAQKEKEGGQ